MKNSQSIFVTSFIILLLLSCSILLPTVQSKNVLQINELQTENNHYSSISVNSTFINLIIRILTLMQNMCGFFIAFFNPFSAPLQKVYNFLVSLLGKLEPWGEISQAILDVIDAVNHLIDVINNMIDDEEPQSALHLY